MLSLAIVSFSFAPNAVPSPSHPLHAARVSAQVMSETSSRRQLVTRAAAGLLSVSAVQSASAKAGQFSKLSVFDIVGEASISSPFQNGGPKPSQITTIEKGTTTYGYAKSDGPILANGFREDVVRERKDFLTSVAIVKSQKALLESKTWWLVRDNFRGQAYNMKQNMLVLNKVLEPSDKAKADKAYGTFVKKLSSLDLACTKKEIDLAVAEYDGLVKALDDYIAIVIPA
jgi:hypothetical protein